MDLQIPIDHRMEVSRNITRRSQSNLALAFILLPKERRQGMSALYAFCREVDDIADDTSVPIAIRRKNLAAWRADTRRACQGESPHLPVIRELQPVIATYRLPFELLDEIIRGVEMDLDIKRYQTFSDLEQYCYRVASAVGLLSIEVFGYQDKNCREYAIALGKALQLTNILRDVSSDAEHDRIYLPQEDLQRHQVTPEEILQGQYSDRYHRLAQSMAQRAFQYYQQAARILPAVDRKSMVAAELMGSVYWRLLKKLADKKFKVFGAEPIRLSKLQKIFLILRTWYRLSIGAMTTNYGPPETNKGTTSQV